MLKSAKQSHLRSAACGCIGQNNNKSHNIIIYGKNCNDDSVYKKYNQFIDLGFTNVYLYLGGLFEWLLLQEIYGKQLFPTQGEENYILKYK